MFRLRDYIQELASRKPVATARIFGSSAYPNINGKVDFYDARRGVVVVADISGLPTTTDTCKSPIFALHIHEGISCTGNEQDLFADTKSHYNPHQCQHPYHAGDLPPLFGNDGFAFSAFLTNRFTIREVLGRAVVIHAGLDDFTSQPAGNAGTKIACGIIER